MVDWRKTILVAPIPCVRGFRPNHKTVELSFPQALDLCLRLVTSTCAGYDDDAQICCEHGGEGGQNVSLSMLLFQLTAGVNMKNMDDWWWWSLPLLLFSFVLCNSSFSFLHFPSSLGFLSLVKGSLMKAGGGWREPPAVAFSSRNAA